MAKFGTMLSILADWSSSCLENFTMSVFVYVSTCENIFYAVSL